MTSSLIDRLNAVSEQVALKRPARVATTGNIQLTGFQTIDGVTPAEDDENLRVLVKNQSAGSENGIYVMATGAWPRADDFDGNRDVVKGTRVPVTEGALGANKTYIVTSSDPVVIEESVITFSEITESLVTTGFAKPRAAVVTVSSDTTLTASEHAGKQIDVSCASGDRVITLPLASDMTNGDRITIRYAAGTNQVTLVGQGTDAINGATSMALGARYESLTLACSGSAWSIVGHARPFATGGVVFIKVASRTLTTPPVSPEPGARYIIAASGTPNGDWSAFANNDVVESNGQGAWIRYTPSESWHAYLEVENKLVFYTSTAWQGLPNTDDPAESNLGYAVFEDHRPNGTVGGSGVSVNVWRARQLNTTVANTIASASLASDTITLPAGKYLVTGIGSFSRTGWTQLRLKSTITATAITGPSILNGQGTADGFYAHLFGILSLPAQEAFKLEYFVESNVSNGDLGAPNSLQSETEIYANVTVIDLASLQGPQGVPGTQGPQGFAGFRYQFASTTAPGDPGAGFARLSHSFGSPAVNAVFIDASSAEPGNPDISDEIAQWNNSGGILRIGKVGAEENWMTLDVASVTDFGGYLALAVSYRAHTGTIANSDAISLQFTAKGEPGATGTPGFPAYDYNYNGTLTLGDPGSGKFLFNHLAFGTLTTTSFSISKFDRLVVDRASDVATWDDHGESGHHGYLYLVNADSGTRIALFRVIGAITDSASYCTMPVAYISGLAPADGARVALLFLPAGATGAIDGDTGLADNRILRSDGGAGAALQSSPITIDDSGHMSGIVNLTRTGFDTFSEQTSPPTPASNLVVLYPKGDGRLYEKDDNGAERGLSAVGRHTVWIPASAMIARTTNGAASGTIEMTNHRNMFRTLDFDAATPEFAQFEIHFPKSWNLGAVSFQPVWSHAATTTNFSVVWGLAAVARSDDDPGDVAFGTAQVSADAGGTTNDIYIGPESAPITATGTPAIDDSVQFQVSRTVSDAADTMAIDARLHGVRLFYTTNAATDV